jgi:hypothetical protein
MLDLDTRRAILYLNSKGHGPRAIARTVGASRNAVKKVLRQDVAEVPKLSRHEIAEENTDRIRELYADCQENLVRVMEKLQDEGLSIAYSTLTAFCRRQGIGVKPKLRAGEYHFHEAQEMQHDTSPHDVKAGGKLRRLQCASLVLCYSRMVYAQVYSVWNRFYCKVFLTEALQYFGGAASLCMLDNSSVIIVHGTGADAVPAPEMAAFGERFGTRFVAHAVGDANRSARVEGPFNYIEKNFYPGRCFQDLSDMNTQLVAWCDKVNHKFSPKLRAKRIELFAAEKPHLKPLPIYIPEVYALHHRVVDLMGYVALHTNRYSVPADLIGRDVEVRETKDRVRVFRGHREVCLHKLLEPKARLRSLLPEHRHDGHRHKISTGRQPMREERELRAAGKELSALVDALKKKRGSRPARAIRRVHRMYIDYPEESLRTAVRQALEYGMLDLERIERMVLRNVAGDFFQLRLPTHRTDNKEDD